MIPELDVQFTGRDHSNGRDSNKPGYLYPNMVQRRKNNFCYYVPQDQNHENDHCDDLWGACHLAAVCN